MWKRGTANVVSTFWTGRNIWMYSQIKFKHEHNTGVLSRAQRSTSYLFPRRPKVALEVEETFTSKKNTLVVLTALVIVFPLRITCAWVHPWTFNWNMEEMPDWLFHTSQNIYTNISVQSTERSVELSVWQYSHTRLFYSAWTGLWKFTPLVGCSQAPNGVTCRTASYREVFRLTVWQTSDNWVLLPL